MPYPKIQILRTLAMTAGSILIVLAGFACYRGAGTDDPAGALAGLAGRMAHENDLQQVLFEDLNGDGTREVVLVYGQRELLNFDVYYRRGEDWIKTPMVNDKGNPREFKGARLDSVRDVDADRKCEIRVSSKLYDGNILVKEVHWSPAGYEVIGQRTVILKPRRVAQVKKDTVAARPKPKPKPYRPLTPARGVYLVRKGDTVYGLAQLLRISIEELESLNNNQLARRGLRIGQRINVPTPGRRDPNFVVRIDKEDHVVSRGESLTSIARQYGVRVQALKSWNPNLPESGRIKVGQKLKIHHAVVDIRQ